MGTFRIYGGRIVTPGRVIENGTLAIEDGRIADISAHAPQRISSGDIDAGGQWVLPGFVDSHSDAIEQEIQPHVRSLLPVSMALRELERKLAGQGITSMYHALGLVAAHQLKAVRTPEMVGAIVAAIHRTYADLPLIRHKVHIRFEITSLEMVDFVEKLLQDGLVHQLSFTDHTPGQGQYRSLDLFRINTLQQGKVSEEEANRYMTAQLTREKVDAARLKGMADLASAQGIPIASHDDDTIEKLDWASRLHATISEFPIQLDVAREARKRGMHVAMGAPNLVRGESTNNNLSALEAVQHDAVDMLCSDYYPPSLLHAVFKLRGLGHDMTHAVNLVSLNPAKALGIDRDAGSLEPGKAADLVLAREWNGLPLVTGTWVNGEQVFKMNYRSEGGA